MIILTCCITHDNTSLSTTGTSVSVYVHIQVRNESAASKGMHVNFHCELLGTIMKHVPIFVHTATVTDKTFLYKPTLNMNIRSDYTVVIFIRYNNVGLHAAFQFFFLYS